LKVVAIGFSASSKDFLNSLKKLKFIDKIYISSTLKDIPNLDDSIVKTDIKRFLKENWRNIDLFIFVGSISIAIRLIAKLIISKDKDPGVIVIDKKGSKIIPLIGIHQTDACTTAVKLANLFDGEVVMTNNSKYEKMLNLDSFGKNWGWNRSGLRNDWSNLVIKNINKEKIFVKQSLGNKLWKQSESGKKLNCIFEKDKVEKEENTVFISTKNFHRTAWHPPILWIGVGCERNTSAKFIEDCIKVLFQKYELSPYSIAGLATVDIKRDEKALLEIKNRENWPIKFFSKNELLQVEIPNPSKIVFDEIGSFSVAEASSLLACGECGSLIVEKNIFKDKDSSGKSLGAVTLAIAESKKQFAPSKGFIHVIGSGPGDLSFLTAESKAALSECSVLIGYKMYLDLLAPLLRHDQMRINSELTKEKERCLEAISLAEQGIKVALVSSGDSGIYGMAGLLVELIQKIDISLRPSFLIHPGISSFQLAASLAGAPLMNDFCAISLSDKLTPWEVIEKRINGALVGDFVVAIFNPRSNQRDWQLRKTIDLFLQIRSKNTPVLVARQVGRDKQEKRFFNLDEIPINEIDMLSIIIIGNSSTKLNNDYLISPRGYL